MSYGAEWVRIAAPLLDYGVPSAPPMCYAPSDALPTYRDAYASHRCRSPFI